MYLKAILRQDIAFFDMEMSAGQAVERMAGDTFLIQDAIGEKVLYIYIYALRLYIMQEVSCKQINLIPTGLIIWTICTTTILVPSEDCTQNYLINLGIV
jgi:hypothetical protein